LQVDVEFVVKDRLERFIEKRYVAALDGLAVKVVWHQQISGVIVKVEPQRFDTADPGVIGNLGDLVLAVRANELPRVVE
jgi:hypothetical protein